MELCYVGGLVMPSSYAMMNEEEMTYVEGGTITINRRTITAAVVGIVGFIEIATNIHKIASVIVNIAPKIASFILGAGPLVQAACIVLGELVAAAAIGLAAIYISGGTMRIG